MSKEKQIEERIELSDIIDYALRDWEDYIYECQEEGNHPIDTFEEWIADAVLKNGYRKQSEWISVDERLPTYKDGKVLIYTAYGISIAERTTSNRWRGDCAIPKLITHWMPLPEAPKGGE